MEKNYMNVVSMVGRLYKPIWGYVSKFDRQEILGSNGLMSFIKLSNIHVYLG